MSGGVGLLLLQVALGWLLPVCVLTVLFFRLFTLRPHPLPSSIEAVLPLRGKWLQRCWAGLLALFLALMIVPAGYMSDHRANVEFLFLWQAP